MEVALSPGELQEQQEAEDYFKDHFFDNVDINNPVPRQRRDDITKGHGPLKGVTGLRRFYKVNELLILPEIRMGFPMVETNANDNDWRHVPQEYA